MSCHRGFCFLLAASHGDVLTPAAARHPSAAPTPLRRAALPFLRQALPHTALAERPCGLAGAARHRIHCCCCCCCTPQATPARAMSLAHIVFGSRRAANCPKVPARAPDRSVTPSQLCSPLRARCIPAPASWFSQSPWMLHDPSSRCSFPVYLTLGAILSDKAAGRDE